MPIYLDNNPYQGVNAHLHSQFQTKGDALSTWSAFHASHIIHLADRLNTALPRNYRAVAEQSLQVLSPGGKGIRRPDITIYDRTPSSGGAEALATPFTPTWAMILEETLTEPDELEIPAILIYQRIEAGQHPLLGDPIVRIELLSPANKAGGSFYTTYMLRRREALLDGLPLVEIDYLHETGSPVLGLPPYPDDPRSYPYHIIVSDPRLPSTAKAVRAYGFNVDTPIPAPPIPLAGDETVLLDYDAVYQFSFTTGRWGDQVDYEQPPMRLESYSEDDQQRIHDRMAALQKAS